MNTQQKNDQYHKEIQRLQKQIDACDHNFKKPIYDPETVMEGYGLHMVGHGSDQYAEFKGYNPVSKDRWSRTCVHCGKVEYTYNTEPVITGQQPKF